MIFQPDRAFRIPSTRPATEYDINKLANIIISSISVRRKGKQGNQFVGNESWSPADDGVGLICCSGITQAEVLLR